MLSKATHVARKLLEGPSGSPLRRYIMAREARQERTFVRAQAARAGVKSFSLDEASPLLGPSSEIDTFFVLGSGASIEELSPENFDEIALQRSIGINNWAIHPFVPDGFSFESVPQVGDGRDLPRALQLLGRRDILEKQPSILVLRPGTREGLLNLRHTPQALASKIRFYGRVTPATRMEGNLARDIESFFRHVSSRQSEIVIDSGASVVRMVTLGILLGFRRIVLAGVDLNGSPYFWEKNPTYLEGLSGPLPVNNQPSGFHETTRTGSRPFSVVTMVKALADYFRSEHDGQLLVSSKNSVLSEFLPVSSWNSKS